MPQSTTYQATEKPEVEKGRRCDIVPPHHRLDASLVTASSGGEEAVGAAEISELAPADVMIMHFLRLTS